MRAILATVRGRYGSRAVSASVAQRTWGGILCGVQSDAIRSLGDIEDRHWWFAERRSLIASQVKGVRPVGPALDVGAAAGGNTRVLVEAGWDCVALEYSADGRGHGQRARPDRHAR